MTRRSQVQILPPLFEKPGKRGSSVLRIGIDAANFCPTFAYGSAERRRWRLKAAPRAGLRDMARRHTLVR